MNSHSAVLDPEKKKFERLIFPILNIRNPKKFKPFSHWLSKNCFKPKKKKRLETKTARSSKIPPPKEPPKDDPPWDFQDLDPDGVWKNEV